MQVVCLGIMYGMGRDAAASKLGISPAEAQSLIRRYLNTYPRIEVRFHRAVCVRVCNVYACMCMLSVGCLVVVRHDRSSSLQPLITQLAHHPDISDAVLTM